MKGICNSCTQTPRYKLVWDIKQALTYLNNYPLNNELSLNILSLKLAMLLVSTATKRGSQINIRRLRL